MCYCDEGYWWFDCSRGCSGKTVLTEPSGNITDGSGEGRTFGTEVTCSWLVAPEGEIEYIDVQFHYLDTSTYDVVCTPEFPVI